MSNIIDAPDLPVKLFSMDDKSKRDYATEFEDWLENYLQNIEGIKLSFSNNGSSFLGSGASAAAFDVNYKNNPAVLKISKNKNDYYNTIKMFNMRNRLGEGKKHIMRVYNNFIVKTPNGPLYFLLVEKLNQINPHIFKMVTGPDGNDMGRNNINAEAIFKDFKFDIDKYTAFVFKLLKNDRANFNKFDDEYVKEVAETIADATYNDLISKDKDKYKIIEEKLKDICNKMDVPSYDEIYDAVKYIDVYMIFPRAKAYQTSTAYSELMPEFESLIKTLKLLSKRNIHWADLHEGNIMERPNSKRTLVISDYGLFNM